MSGTEERMRGAFRGWRRPLVIAHRGASGYLPEHTLESYAMAHGLGADVLEPDVVLTSDGVPICLHDIHLERVTDAAQRFPGRERSDGRWYAIDFTLDEIRTLSATGGARHGLRGCAVPTLVEMLDLTQHMNRGTGRHVGIAPELKAPTFHREEGRPMEKTVLSALQAAGYERPGDRCIVQCFEGDALDELREVHRTNLVLLELLSGDAPSESELDRIAARADAIGPSKAMIAATDGALVRVAHARGLGVIPYTFQEDEAETRRFFAEYGVDGLFSDFPDVALRART